MKPWAGVPLRLTTPPSVDEAATKLRVRRLTKSMHRSWTTSTRRSLAVEQGRVILPSRLAAPPGRCAAAYCCIAATGQEWSRLPIPPRVLFNGWPRRFADLFADAATNEDIFTIPRSLRRRPTPSAGTIARRAPTPAGTSLHPRGCSRTRLRCLPPPASTATRDGLYGGVVPDRRARGLFSYRGQRELEPAVSCE